MFAQDDVDAHGWKVFWEGVEGVPDFLMAVDSCLSHDGKMFNFSVEGNHTITPRKPHDNYSAENVGFDGRWVLIDGREHRSDIGHLEDNCFQASIYAKISVITGRNHFAGFDHFFDARFLIPVIGMRMDVKKIIQRRC